MRSYMNKNFLPLSCALWILSISLSYAANWTAISITDDYSIYYDEKSIRSVESDKNLKQVWQKVIYHKDIDNTQKNDYMLSLEYFNCKRGKRALNKLYVYNADKALKYNFTHEKLIFEDIVPDSLSEIIFKSVCLK